MTGPREPRSRPVLLVGIGVTALVLGLAGCATYGERGGGVRTWQAEPAERILGHEPPHARIRVVAAEATFVLEGARLEADSVIGFREAEEDDWERVALPLDGPERLEVKKLNTGLTVLRLGASAALLVVGLATGS